MRRIIAIVTHRDSDLVLLLCLAAVTFVLEVVAGEALLALFAASLCTLAVSMLRLRRAVDSLQSRERGFGGVFLEIPAPDLAERIENATAVWLVGVSLDRTIRNLYGPLEHYLASGRVLRVIVVDPDASEAVRIADRRAYNEHGVDQRRAQILFTCDTLSKLVSHCAGKVELHVFDDPLTFGAVMIDPDPTTARSWIQVQHYSYKKQAVVEANPIFTLTPNDGRWFTGFREEILNLWRDSAVRVLGSPPSPGSGSGGAAPTAPGP